MTLYELIFILLFFGSLMSLLAGAFLWGTSKSKTILFALAAVGSVHFLILFVTDIFISQKVFKVGEDECFDEMCLAVMNEQTTPDQELIPSGPTAGKLMPVTVRITSHSRGRAQAEGGLRGRLYEGGIYIKVSDTGQKAYDGENGGGVRLTHKLSAGESILSVLVFEVPQGMRHPSLALDHGFTPGYFVIEESPFFHKPDIPLLPHDR